MIRQLMSLSINFPKTTIFVALAISIVLGAQIPRITIDTDPENMLEHDQPDRQFYNQVKKRFGIYDLIVVGIVDSEGIYRTASLTAVSNVVNGILGIEGVITEDVVSFTTTNNVSASNGMLSVRRIMSSPPESAENINAIKVAIDDNPLLSKKLASTQGEAVAIYVPITSKDQANRIGSEIEAIAKQELTSTQQLHLAGLPIAEDRFGAEMFQQMGMMAPLSGMAVFLLLWIIFRKMTLIIPVMVVSMLTVVWGMGLLIGSGFTVHIMSSMIPVFLMPIAVLDSVHILSEFYDRYPTIKDRKNTLSEVFDVLYKPMLFTSLTSAAGFASLMLADIPPVQVFGAFVAIGIMIAWLLSITFIPAAIMLVGEDKLKKKLTNPSINTDGVGKFLATIGRVAVSRRLPLMISALVIFLIGVWGISKTVVNDNPVNWFSSSHPIRVADKELNKLFGGTYMAYLVIDGQNKDDIKRPEVMHYIRKLQEHVEKDPAVGKTSSIADIVSQVNYVVHDADKQFRMLPDNVEEIAQYLFLYQMSGETNDLDNFVTYTYDAANIWIQMSQGDNSIMARIEQSVSDFLSETPPPKGVSIRWSGLTYLNKTWQDLMVTGMIKAIAGGFFVVFVMMVLLFRSFPLGILAMLPLTFAITLSYGLVGLVGKDYDMPIAVCSSLALGLSIDFAIHFIQRYRHLIQQRGFDYLRAMEKLFGEPARAIFRNAIVIAIGFLPMVLSPLGPYKTVGVFFALLMVFSAAITLFLLPGLLKMRSGPQSQSHAMTEPVVNT